MSAAGKPGRMGEVEMMTWWQAMILGVVEGLTEFLPVSSTGHLLVVQHLLGLGGEGAADEAAADAYAICIQAGAILAVLGLYAGRVVEMGQGLLGRSERGRRLLTNLVMGFLPAAVLGLALNEVIKAHLFGPWPVVAAWLVGGVAILATAWWQQRRVSADDVLTQGEDSPAGGLAEARGLELDQLNWRLAVLIGLAQCLAMWPGVSRSLVTIVAGVLVGMKLRAAVEFSFLLGVVTLGAATAYDGMKHGDAMLALYGPLPLVIGAVFAFISAALAVKWMVAYLRSHGLALFGWYRIAAAVLVGLLLWSGVLEIGAGQL